MTKGETERQKWDKRRDQLTDKQRERYRKRKKVGQTETHRERHTHRWRERERQRNTFNKTQAEGEKERERETNIHNQRITYRDIHEYSILEREIDTQEDTCRENKHKKQHTWECRKLAKEHIHRYKVKYT